jgi:xanthine dehydrogenase/oxidase
VSSFDHLYRKVVHNSVNACLAPIVSCHGKHVISIEGLGNVDSPHAVQEVVAKAHGSQCGFCTPGIVMSLYAQLKNKPNSSDHDIEHSFDGNLCRCTGYRPILDGAKKLACASACAKDGHCSKETVCLN